MKDIKYSDENASHKFLFAKYVQPKVVFNARMDTLLIKLWVVLLLIHYANLMMYLQASVPNVIKIII